MTNAEYYVTKFFIKKLQKHQGVIITTTVKPFDGTTTRGSGLNRLIKFLKANPEWLETVFICNSDDAEMEILHYFENKIEKELFDSGKLISCLECIETNIGIKSKIKSLVRKLCLSTRRNLSIYDLLVCPICKEKLLKGNNELICRQCGVYPIINNIPVMIQI